MVIDWKVNCMVIEIQLKPTSPVTISSPFSHQLVNKDETLSRERFLPLSALLV